MNFREILIKKIGFTEEEVEISGAKFEKKLLTPKEFYLKEGDISSNLAIVISGILRTFIIDEEGNEITRNFHKTGSLLLCVDSFNKTSPATENIIAITSSELITITNQKWLSLLEQIPKWNFICRSTGDKIAKELTQRTTEFQMLTAAQRYNKFCKEHPEVYKNATLGQIASYLGIDIATLSRIRKKVSF